MIAMALQYLEEAAWLLTMISIFPQAEIDGGQMEGGLG